MSDLSAAILARLDDESAGPVLSARLYRDALRAVVALTAEVGPKPYWSKEDSIAAILRTIADALGVTGRTEAFDDPYRYDGPTQ